MILNFFIQILIVTAGIIFLTLVYFLVSYVAGDYTLPKKVTNEISKISTEEYNKITNPQEKLKAVIICNHIPPDVGIRYKTSGYTDCRTQNKVYNGNLLCEHGCLGLKTCLSFCPNNSITFLKGSVFINNTCNGCGLCISVCPKNLIKLVPIDSEKNITCNAINKLIDLDICPTAVNGYSIEIPAKL